jgi:putative tricarboxylic transport membrane protein
MVKKSDLIVGIILFCLSGVILLSVKGLPLIHKGTGFGPGAFPLIVGIGLLLLSVLLMIGSFFYKVVDEKATKKSLKSQWKPMFVLLATMGYVLIITVFGFLVSSILYVFVMTQVFGEKRYFVGAIYAGGFACLAYLFFSVWLKVALPEWSLW